MAKNQTTPLQGWTSSPNGRGTIDILSSSGITLFLCSWSVLCPNISPPSYSVYKKAWQKFELAGLCFLGPEFIFQLAIGQWCAARRSVAEFDRLEYQGWSMTHAFFANMGGFVLQAQLSPRSEEDFPTFPLNSKQVLYLVENGYVPYSAVAVEREEIQDKDKVDGVVRLIIVCQIFWYLVCCISRLVQHLDVTVIELATVGFILCSTGTYFFWRQKPMDVNRAITLRPNSTLEEILCEAGECASEPYRRTPMDFVGREEWSWTLYWTYGKGVLKRLGFNFDRPGRPIDKIPDDEFPLITGSPMWILFVFQMGYGAVHLTGWSLPFPTHTEKQIWHIATVTIMICISVTWIVEVFAWRIPSRLGRTESGFTAEKAPPPSADIARPARSPSPIPSTSCTICGLRGTTANGKLKQIAARLRNNTTPHDPVMDVPLRTLIPVALCVVIYVSARGFVIIEGFINLRALPPSAYEISLFQTGYAAVHMGEWNLGLWHMMTLGSIGVDLTYWVAHLYAWEITPAIRTRRDGHQSEGYSKPHCKANTTHPACFCLTCRVEKFLGPLKNNSYPHDPAPDIPLKAIIPILGCCVDYCLSRGYVVIEGFIHLRALPPSAYESVNWAAFMLHF